jgi:hypothetical protein
MTRSRRLENRIPPDLGERYDRKRNEGEDQRQLCFAFCAATVDTMTPTFAALRTRLRAILRVLDAEGSMNILLSTEE